MAGKIISRFFGLALALLTLPGCTDAASELGSNAVTEALNTATMLKSEVQIFYQQTSACPANGAGGLGLPDAYAGVYVAALAVRPLAGGCEIVVTLRGPDAPVWQAEAQAPAGRTVRLQLSGQPMAWHWRCVGDMPARFLPPACSSAEN